jgi:hypothetical protein
MKGIIFSGCSFTWGQGLYFYSNLPKLVKPINGSWDATWVTPAQLKFKNIIRYPRLVANRLNTFEVVKTNNGGSNAESLSFISDLFKSEDYQYDDISCIVFQLTDVTRDNFSYDLVKKQLSINVKRTDVYNVLQHYHNIDTEIKDKVLDTLALITLEKLEHELKKYELAGIKTYVLAWPDYYAKHIQNNEWLNKRFIKLSYLSEEFNSIHALQYEGKRLTISTDTNAVGSFIMDDHPSKLCHKIIADNIINKIENENV